MARGRRGGERKLERKKTRQGKGVTVGGEQKRERDAFSLTANLSVNTKKRIAEPKV